MFLFFFINNDSLSNQKQNPLLYDTFKLSSNDTTLRRCYLEVGNGNWIIQVFITHQQKILQESFVM